MTPAKTSTFVRQRLDLNARIDAAAFRPANGPRSGAVTAEFDSLRATIVARQSIGDPPKAANDNNLRAPVRVRKATGKFVRGAFADTLPMVLTYRNTPDHLPEPIASSWSTDPSSFISEVEFDDQGEANTDLAEDLALEIRPSIAFIHRQIEKGEQVRAAPKPLSKSELRRGLRQPMQGPITAIGKLKFSDGTHRHRVTLRTEAGIVSEIQEAPAGTMLGTIERVGGAHGGDANGVAHMSNTRTTALYFGMDENGNPNNWRPFIPRGETRRGKSLTPAESRALIDEAIAKTPVMPPVTKCPPGIATGTSRFSDQFVGLVSGSTGKGGAPNWVEHFIALEERKAFLSAVAALDGRSLKVITAATTARNFAEVGAAVGQGPAYARRMGGKLALVAANDNFAVALKKFAA